ncbi:MAG TPA: DUF1330 domain-containing protein [Hyphomicrobiaceae bacterium]|nr:DUF1330 domain-containing protein [Hyphomicrobiaceae bacterium]
MPSKAYWIFQMDVTDPEGYKAYQADAGRVISKYGARFVTRGGRCVVVEGAAPSRTVIIEFPDYDTAMQCWNSPEYERSKALRQGNAAGNVIIVEGYDGPQPGDH